MHNLFRVGENGLLVLSDFASEESLALEHFAVYSLSGKAWKTIDDTGHGTVDRPMAFGQTSPVFAVCDEDTNIRIYDAEAAGLRHCIHTELPLASVAQIGFILDDQYMFVLTKDNQFIIYAIDTRDMVFRTFLINGYMKSAVITWPDRTNNRLYILKDAHILCVDVRSWEPLFSGKDVVFYSAAQNEICVYSRDNGTAAYSLKAIPIPTTSKLIGIAQKVFH